MLFRSLAKFEKTVALLAGFPSGHLVFAQHASVANNMSVLLKQVFAQFPGKGGGSGDVARGRLNDASQGERAIALAKELLFAA